MKLGQVVPIPQGTSSSAEIHGYKPGEIHDTNMYSGPTVEALYPGTGIKELDPYIVPGDLHIILTDQLSSSQLEKMLTGPQQIHRTSGNNKRNLLVYQMLPHDHNGHIIICTGADRILRLMKSEDYVREFKDFNLVSHFYWCPDIDSTLYVYLHNNTIFVPWGKSLTVKNPDSHWYDGFLRLLSRLDAKLR